MRSIKKETKKSVNSKLQKHTEAYNKSMSSILDKIDKDNEVTKNFLMKECDMNHQRAIRLTNQNFGRCRDYLAKLRPILSKAFQNINEERAKP